VLVGNRDTFEQTEVSVPAAQQASMGGGVSRPSPEADSALLKFPKLFEALFITKDVSLWACKFAELDSGGVGRIGVTACLLLSHSESTPFNEKLFRFLDCEGNGSQDLRGFVFSTWHLCSLDKRGMASFIYDIYSAEDVRFDKYGLKALLGDVYSSRLSEESQEVKNLKRIIDRLDRDKVLSREEFILYTDKHPVFLAPVARMQDRIQSAVFGKRYWREMEHKRKSCQSRLYSPVYWAQLQTKCYQSDSPDRRK